MSQLYTSLFAGFDNISNTYITGNTSKFINYIAEPAFVLLAIYVLLWGLSHILGLIREPITDAAKRFIKIGFIIGIALNYDTYSTYVINVITKGPEEIASVFVSNYSTIGQTLDTVFDETWEIGNQFWANAGFFDGNPGMYIVAVIIYAIACVLTAYSAFLMILSKIAISILVAVGPLFIIAAFFESTRKFLESWVAQLCNYGLLTVLVIACNAFILEVLRKTALATSANIKNADDVSTVAPLIVIGIVSGLILSQLPSIASGLAGGLSISSLGAFSGAMRSGTGIATKVSGARAANQYVSHKTAEYAGKGVRNAANAGYSFIKRPFSRTNAASRG